MGISVHDLLIAFDMALFIHFPLLALCVRRQTDSAGPLLWEKKPPAETGTDSPESTLSLWRILYLKAEEGAHLLVFVISRCQKWSQNVSRFAATEKKIMGFYFGLTITGVYLGKLETAKPIRPLSINHM